MIRRIVPAVLAAAAIALALVVSSAAQERDALPDTSLFRLNVRFTNQDDRAFSLTSLRGRPVLISMFYGSCRTMCPILVEDARAIDQALTPEQRAELRVVLVTLDGERDTPERLRALAAERSLPLDRWTLLRGSDHDVRELAMVLGVRYRRLTDGGYAHTSMLTLLDREGRIAAQIEGLRQPNAPIVGRVRALLR